MAYKPVACDIHSEYELAIMRGGKLMLSWRMVDGETCRAKVKPVDIFARKGEEFLAVIHDGERLDIRLDRIISADSSPFEQ